MHCRPVRLAVAAALVGGSLVSATAAFADPGPGTWTKISAPAGPSFVYHYPLNGSPHFVVSGTASPDVTSVDIVCVLRFEAGFVIPETLAANVPVSNGAFSGVAAQTSPLAPCRMRAVPSGVDPTTTDVSSYAGPAMYQWTGAAQLDSGGVPYGLTALAEQSTGVVEAQDAGACGAEFLGGVTTTTALLGPGAIGCLGTLGFGNVTSTGVATASAVKVDGHNAYLPYIVHDYLIGELSLPVAQPKLTTTFTRSSNGDLTWTESAALMRCKAADTYPPTMTSCPSLTTTGVTFERTGTIDPAVPKISMQDQFVSSDGSKHTVTADYQNQVEPPDTGATGYRFPGQTHFAPATPDQVVTGLGTKSTTFLMRSNMYAYDGDPGTATLALTYSKAPSKIVFNHTNGSKEPDTSQLDYSLSVPAKGSAYLRLATGWGALIADAQKLGTSAQSAMVNAPKITSPKNRATLTGHTITGKGTVSAGGNGLPTSVSVNGHKASLTSTGNFSVKLTESYGKHTLTATATDSAGNTKAASITVTNKA